MLGLVIVGGAVVDVLEPGGPSPRWVDWVKVVLGVLPLALAVRKWSARPRDGGVPEIPAWVAAAESLTAAKSLGLAFLLAVANPTNVVITVSAAVAIADATSRVPDREGCASHPKRTRTRSSATTSVRKDGTPRRGDHAAAPLIAP